MAYTYDVTAALNLAKKMVKNIPISTVDVTVCDMVSSRMWNAFPWRERVQNIASPGILLVDGQQDYNAPINIHTLLRGRITRTDVTPNYSWPLEPTEHLEPQLRNVSYNSLALFSHEPDLGKLRLESAVQVSSPAVLYLNGEYLIQATKIINTTDALWFKDEYLEVFAKGLAYWAYKLADDSRAGMAATDGEGRQTYSGMLAEWMDGIEQMKKSEDFGALPQLFPDDQIGSAPYGGSFIFP